MSFLLSFLAAIVTFTRIPVPWQLSARDFEKASLQLPFLGCLIGGLQILVLALLEKFLVADLALFLTMLLPILLSGGMHEDGLADFADGMLGGQSIEQRLEIMKDPRVGSYGVLALLIILPGSYLALRGIQPDLRPQALLLATTLSRSLCVMLLAALPYKNHLGSRSHSFLPSAFHGWSRVFPHWPLVPLVLYLQDGPAILSFALLLLVIFYGMKRYLQKKLAGLTGDCLGASIKLTEFGLLLLGSIIWAASS